MNWKPNLSRLFKPKVKELFKSDVVIEPAFKVGNKTYYRFADINNLPYKRGLMAFAVYAELDMRCTREHLVLHTDAIDTLIKSNEIDIFKIKQLNDQLRQRLQLTTDIDLMYKLASVAYFDENEQPESYDSAYAQKKIEFWKANAGVADFFLSQPMLELMPFLQSVDVDLEAYSNLNKELNQIHSDAIRLLSSKKQ